MLLMNSLKKVLMGIAALAALALGGSAIAGAANNGGDKGGEGKDDGADQALTTPAAEKAGSAAAAKVGGKVVSVERTDEDAPAFYEVKVDKAGKLIEVQVSKDFAVTSQKADDEGDDKGDGDGESQDD